MSKRAVIALDVGGTSIDAACVSADGCVIGELLTRASPAAGTKEEILSELASVIDAARAGADGAEITACAVAMPAPFDYPAGTSYMLHKFQALYSLPLGDLLRARTGLPVCFVNDADAFGLGVSWRQFPPTRRFVALTIGTGLGGSFIEDGKAVQDARRVPAGGEVWNLPFGDGILEDQVSARAVTASYGHLRAGDQRSAREVSSLARQGDPAAIAAFHALGQALGSGLAPVLTRFEPAKVVIGGKVGQSLDLFGQAMREELAAAGLPGVPVIAAPPGNMAIWGAARSLLALGAVR